MSETPALPFLGGSGALMGLKYLVRANGRQILLEYGLFQGLKKLCQRNWSKPPFDVSRIEAVSAASHSSSRSARCGRRSRQASRLMSAETCSCVQPCADSRTSAGLKRSQNPVTRGAPVTYALPPRLALALLVIKGGLLRTKLESAFSPRFFVPGRAPVTPPTSTLLERRFNDVPSQLSVGWSARTDGRRGIYADQPGGSPTGMAHQPG
jgi:hypothetical protein